MGYFEAQYGLDYIKKRVNDITSGINKINYGKGEFDLCSFESEDTSVYLGVYDDEFCWTFSVEGENEDALYISADTLELDSLETLEEQAKSLLDQWNKDKLESLIE